jgi:hypothetical protein
MRAALFALLGLVSAASSAAAHAAAPESGLALLASDRREGRIDEETYLLESFRLAFAPESGSARYRLPERGTIRCFTPMVIRYHESRASLRPSTVSEIERHLHPPAGPALRATHVSPAGLFEFTYSTSGPDAVPAEDVDPANGIPDFVERCAEYADQSWQTEITDLGFVAPALPGDGTYDMSFQALGAGFYGYTTISGGTTEIVLHNNFAGFGWPGGTDDPDGDPLGRAKATIAHEFKHASQFTTSNWSEGQWVELDAMWVEDIVFDQVNDYHNWLTNGSLSQLDSPQTRLDNGGEGSYEDCLWQTYLSTVHGTQIIVDFWELRDQSPGENVKSTYRDAMALYGTTWDESWPKFYEFCWFTGSRAEPPFGFPDASDLYRMEFVSPVVQSYPFSVNGDVDRLSAHPRRFAPAGDAARILFDGEDGHASFTVSVIAEEWSGAFTIVRPALDANNDLDYAVPAPWSDLQYVGVIVTNNKRTGDTVPYSLTVLDEPLVTHSLAASGAGIDRLALRTAQPNPFRGSTRIRYAVPRAGTGSVRILDVRGRVVRTLHEGPLPAGEGAVAWDGRDDSGRKAASGVYWSRIETANESVARKLTVLD